MSAIRYRIAGMRQREPWFDLHDPGLSRPGVAIIGLPFDGSASLRAGAAQAPGRLREISRTCDPVTRRGRPIAGLSVRDFGDVAPLEGPRATHRQYLEAALARLDDLPPDSFVLALGGDNSVSIPCLQSFARRHGDGAGVIWFDAHPDLFEAYDGNPDSHACALRRGMTLAGIAPQRAVLLGTRSYALEETMFIRSEGIEVIPAAECLATAAAQVASRIADRLAGSSAVYLGVDIDGFDSACAPGTGYPMPGGITAEWFFSLMEGLLPVLPVRGMDITEIAPPLDPNDVTAFLGVQVVLEALGILAEMQPFPSMRRMDGRTQVFLPTISRRT